MTQPTTESIDQSLGHSRRLTLTIEQNRTSARHGEFSMQNNGGFSRVSGVGRVIGDALNEAAGFEARGQDWVLSADGYCLSIFGGHVDGVILLMVERCPTRKYKREPIIFQCSPAVRAWLCEYDAQIKKNPENRTLPPLTLTLDFERRIALEGCGKSPGLV